MQQPQSAIDRLAPTHALECCCCCGCMQSEEGYSNNNNNSHDIQRKRTWTWVHPALITLLYPTHTWIAQYTVFTSKAEQSAGRNQSCSLARRDFFLLCLRCRACMYVCLVCCLTFGWADCFQRCSLRYICALKVWLICRLPQRTLAQGGSVRNHRLPCCVTDYVLVCSCCLVLLIGGFLQGPHTLRTRYVRNTYEMRGWYISIWYDTRQKISHRPSVPTIIRFPFKFFDHASPILVLNIIFFQELSYLGVTQVTGYLVPGMFVSFSCLIFETKVLKYQV